MIVKNYTTTLETLAHDVGAILDHKLSASSPEAVADYVSFACENLAQNIERAKQAKKELDDYIKEQTSAIETIKEGTAKWLTSNGIDKLEGMRISSLTSYTPKEKETFNVLDNDFFIGMGFKIETVTVDKEKAKEWIDKQIEVNGYHSVVEVHGDKFTLETILKQPLVKINKRKEKTMDNFDLIMSVKGKKVTYNGKVIKDGK